MSTRVDAEALVLTFEATSGQTSALDAGNVLLAAMAAVTFGSTPTVSVLKRGGSGGTDITPAESDRAFFFGDSAVMRGGYADPSGGSAETVYGALSSGGFVQLALAGVVYSDADGVHDWTTNEGVAGETTTTVASVTVPNVLDTEKVAGFCFAASDSLNMAAFTAVSGTSLVTYHFRVGEAFLAVAVLERTATADGSVALQVNVNTDASAGIGWAMCAGAITNAAGGPSFNPAWAIGSNTVINAGA